MLWPAKPSFKSDQVKCIFRHTKFEKRRVTKKHSSIRVKISPERRNKMEVLKFGKDMFINLKRKQTI